MNLKKRKSKNMRTAVDGISYPLTELRRIRGEYWKMGLHCHFVNGQWHRYNNGKIAQIHGEDNKWDLIGNLKNNPEYRYGIINNKGEKGYFRVDPFNNVLVRKRELTGNDAAMNGKILAPNYYLPLGSIYYRHKDAPLIEGFRSERDKALNFTYGANENNSAFTLIRDYYAQYDHQNLNKGVKRFSKFLKTSFGCEFETHAGCIPTNELFKNGFVSLKDGSLKGGLEFTSVPLEGEKGLQSLYNMSKLLVKRSAQNEKCALHFHFGVKNFIDETDKDSLMKYALACWRLYGKLEQEIRAMTLPYRRSEDFLSSKDKDHCADLPNLSFMTGHLWTKSLVRMSKVKFNHARNELTMKLTDCSWDLIQSKHHGLHPNRSMSKWHSQGRYLSFNVIPALFNGGQTFEFRAHEGTVNPIKTINWLFITQAIMMFAEKYQDTILKYDENHTLADILSVYRTDDDGNFLADYLSEYIESKKLDMSELTEDFNRNMVYLEQDNQYSFNYKGVRCLLD